MKNKKKLSKITSEIKVKSRRCCEEIAVVLRRLPIRAAQYQFRIQVVQYLFPMRVVLFLYRIQVVLYLNLMKTTICLKKTQVNS